ncbi:uncharacterized protein G2W53_016246 [Senna tora]|uniref:Uncharacterized protein n=1 Tax=Senna tora TaxID=362788 RepID=A0A834WJE5_9FABA|nr:uncharacterized protein G2W53_016246 [Senna tora]
MDPGSLGANLTEHGVPRQMWFMNAIEEIVK